MNHNQKLISHSTSSSIQANRLFLQADFVYVLLDRGLHHVSKALSCMLSYSLSHSHSLSLSLVLSLPLTHSMKDVGLHCILCVSMCVCE